MKIEHCEKPLFIGATLSGIALLAIGAVAYQHFSSFNQISHGGCIAMMSAGGGIVFVVSIIGYVKTHGNRISVQSFKEDDFKLHLPEGFDFQLIPAQSGLDKNIQELYPCLYTSHIEHAVFSIYKSITLTALKVETWHFCIMGEDMQPIVYDFTETSPNVEVSIDTGKFFLRHQTEERRDQFTACYVKEDQSIVEYPLAENGEINIQVFHFMKFLSENPDIQQQKEAYFGAEDDEY